MITLLTNKEKDELFKTSSIISVVKKMDLENFKGNLNIHRIDFKDNSSLMSKSYFIFQKLSLNLFSFHIFLIFLRSIYI